MTTRSVEGTLMAVPDPKPAQITVNADRQFQTFDLAKDVVVERESTSSDHTAATVARISSSDLTPGEYVKLQIDGRGQVTHARAIVRVQRAKVRSAAGKSIVLDDGSTVTIGSLVRFVNQKGQPSATAALRPGETVLVFHHPQTGNVYRIAAEPHARARKCTDGSKK